MADFVAIGRCGGGTASSGSIRACSSRALAFNRRGGHMEEGAVAVETLVTQELDRGPATASP